MTLQEQLRSTFGFDTFRPGQREAIESLLGKKHTLIVMPTGAGKSLVFQLTAIQLPGLTLVISPLIALMKDQVDSLKRRGIQASYINSSQSGSEQAECLDRLSRGEYRIVYVAPERLRSVSFQKALKNQTVSLLAVDEAHCISEWGHDFRPDYLHISQARAAIGSPLVAALTATATPQVQSDIIRLLGMNDVINIVTGFNRSNLCMHVRYTSGIPAKLLALQELFSSRETGAVIIYTGTRRDAEEVTEFVREVIKLPAEFYHAGLPADKRTRIQNEFITGGLNVICATNAFGMGIDRANVRQVIHYSLPGSLEAYYQEAGRAGRDGLPACATLLYDPKDRALQEFFIQQSELTEGDLRAIHDAIHNNGLRWTTAEELSLITEMHPVQVKVGLSALERAGMLDHLGDEGSNLLLQKKPWDQKEIENAASHIKEHISHRKVQLEGIISYAETNSCRRQMILDYFGDDEKTDVHDCCDNCQNRKVDSATKNDLAVIPDEERTALIILDCIWRIKVKVGRDKLAQILHGSKAKEILKFQHDKNIYYGRLVVMRQGDIEALIEQLIQKGYIKVVGGNYPVLRLMPRGESAVKQKESIELVFPKSFQATGLRHTDAKREARGTVDFTANLLSEGLTPEQIARDRGLSVSSIYSPCAKLIAGGSLELSRVIPPKVQEQIEAAIQKVGSAQALTPIKMLLPDEIEYGMISCVVESIKNKSKVTGSVEEDITASNQVERVVELGNTKSSQAVPELINALQSNNGNVRRLAASALGKIRDTRAVKPLLDLLESEERSQVRQYIVRALGKIGDHRANRILLQIESDDREIYYTRKSAGVALRNIAGHTQKRSSVQSHDNMDEQSGAVSAFLAKPHPRPLNGPWQCGWALDFHSRFEGGDWVRSKIGNLTYRLKYEDDVSVLTDLVKHTLDLAQSHSELIQVDAILPVPPSKSRKTDPVLAYSSKLSEKLNIPLHKLLVKTRQTEPQKEFHTLAQKHRNVAGAFTIKGSVKDKRLLVVDDLYDSGATLEEITRMLINSGATIVNILTLTRTIHSDL